MAAARPRRLVGGRRRRHLVVLLAIALCTAIAPTSTAAAQGACQATLLDGFTQPPSSLRGMVIFIDFEDAPAQPGESFDDYTAKMFPDIELFRQLSHGRLDLQLEVTEQWFRMPEPSTAYGFGTPSTRWEDYITTAIELADPRVDFSDVDVVYITAQRDGELPNSPAHPGAWGAQADGDGFVGAVTYGQDIFVWDRLHLVHETSHLLGLPDLYDYSRSTDIHHFVGGWDVMGRINGHAPDMMAYQKLQLGWIDHADRECVTDAGSTTVELQPLSSSTGTRAVMIPHSAEGPPGSRQDAVWVLELRDGTGLDAGACATGVLAYEVDPSLPSGGGIIQVLDARPGSGGDGHRCLEKDDATFTPADGVVDLGDGLSFQVDDLGDMATITVVRDAAYAGAPGTGGEGSAEVAVDGRPLQRDRWSDDVTVTTRVGAPSARAAALEVSAGRFVDDGASHVVLSRDDTFPDALAASPLLADGPLLLDATPGAASLSADVAAEIDRVLPDGGIVYVVGGPAAVSQDVAAQLVDAGYVVRRLAGDGRVQTALAIADEVSLRHPDSAGTVLLARAGSPADNPTAAWADSISGGGFAASRRHPVVITGSGSLDPQVADFLRGRQTVILLGGPAALSADVEASVRVVADLVQRIAGETRDGTAARIAFELWGRSRPDGRFTLFPGVDVQGWAFGLVGAGLAADHDAPLLPVNRASLSTHTEDMLTACGGPAVQTLVVAPESVVSGSLEALIEQVDGVACGSP